MSDFIIRPGDSVICIDAGPPRTFTMRHRLCKDRLEEGAVYSVNAVVWLRGEKGLHIGGKDHTPTDGWRACRFRKILEGHFEEACAHGEQRFELHNALESDHDPSPLTISEKLLKPSAWAE